MSKMLGLWLALALSESMTPDHVRDALQNSLSDVSLGFPSQLRSNWICMVKRLSSQLQAGTREQPYKRTGVADSQRDNMR